MTSEEHEAVYIAARNSGVIVGLVSLLGDLDPEYKAAPEAVCARALRELNDARLTLQCLIAEHGGEVPPRDLHLSDAIKRLVRVVTESAE